MQISMTWPQLRRGECTYQGQRVRLTRMECEVLSVLLMHRGRRVGLTMLIEAIYPDPDLEPDFAARCIMSILWRTRQKVPGAIKSTHGWGWEVGLPVPMSMAA